MLKPQNVTAIILNYNNPDDTCACLRALHADPDGPSKILIVDNASSLGDCSAILAEWRKLEPKVDIASLPEKAEAPCLIRLSENLGYAGGNNVGMRAALMDSGCAAVWVLNNDTIPQPGALRALCDALNSCDTAGMAGSTLVFPDEKLTVQCAGGFSFCPWTGRTVPLLGGETLQEALNMQPSSITAKLDYLCGASLLVLRTTIEKIGFLPEEYFLYYEDAAYGLRAAQAGITFVWASASIVLHKEGGSTKASTRLGSSPVRSPFMDYLSLRNRTYLVRKKGLPHFSVLLLSFFGVAVNRLRRRQWKRLPLLWLAAYDGITGRMGRPDRKFDFFE